MQYPVLWLTCACTLSSALHIHSSSTTVHSIVSILISRFILNLRTVYFTLHDESIRESKYSTVRFARTVTGNLGAPLELTVVDVDGCEDPSRDEWQEERTRRDIYSREPILVGLPLLEVELEGPELEVPTKFMMVRLEPERAV